MKQLFLSTILLLLSATFVHAQERKCNTMENLERLKAQDSQLELRMNDIETFTQNYVRNNALQQRAVITIPVVFHVLYNTTAQNISDAQINAQIAQLNADFRKLNSDFGSVPSVFQGVAADCEVQFCLAQRTPAGVATTGIERKSTTITGWGSNDACKSTSTGGLNAWDATKYLNIWTVNFNNGLLGYAQFPGGSASTDGVVLQYNSVGSLASPTSYTPYNKGRTATHEVGHWLNLRHIWGDANCGSDLVSDTPTQQTSNYGCPSFPHTTCSNGANGDMFMNYMDYVDDGCMQMFTAGQKARMQALFATGGARVGLVTSNGCTPVSGGTTCATPSGLSAGSITSSGATLSWTAVSGATSYNVQYKLSSASTWATTTSTTTSKALTGLSASSTYNYQVQAVCSSTSSSAYSTASSFTTLASGSTSCTDSYESNNTSGTAKVIPANTNIKALISTSTDKDWFRVSNSSTAKNIKLTLSSLPADYDVKLYSPSGTLLATAQNSGTTNESIVYNNGVVGSYYVQIYGYNGAYNATSCYNLLVQTSTTAFRFEQGSTSNEKLPSTDEVNLYPNPTKGLITIELPIGNEDEKTSVQIIDMNGRALMQEERIVGKDAEFIEMDCSKLNTGVYMVRVMQGDILTVKKLIVTK